jgi:transposase InsO family protein
MSFSSLEQIHRDFDAPFRSQEFVKLTSEAGVRITHAAPRHQEQNGICESNWRNIRNLAFAFMNDAHVDMTFFPLDLEHAWTVHSILPHSALTMEDGTSQYPHNVYYNTLASIADFKVLFCPAVMIYENVFVSNQDFSILASLLFDISN